MNTHEQINEMLAGYILGELSDSQSSEVEGHLAGCQDCGGEVKRLKALIESTAQMSELSADEQTCESARKALFETIVSDQIKEPTLRPDAGLIVLWRTIMKSGMTKLAAAAVIVLGAYFGLHFIGGPDMAKTAWAEVTSRAAQVDYVHCYWLKSRGERFFRQFEAWYAHGKLVKRGNKGGMMYDDGQIQQFFDEQGRRTAQQPSFFAEGQTFFEVFTVGLLSDKNEQFSRQTPINVGDDFLIYEFDPPADMDKSKWLECISVTVGKNSLLPVQIKMYEKESDDYDLVMFDYEASEKPAEFFEPPGIDAPHGRAEVLLDGEEVMIDIAGAPGIETAIVRLHSKSSDNSGEPTFSLDVAFIVDEGYRSNTNDFIRLRLNEAQQCGVGKDLPDGKYRNVRFSPLLKPSDREDTYIVEMWCWLRTKR
ncbi:MAG: anti-sigma factor family protein [Planctomycetota bacterium]|jgi:hypothetical protein